MLIIIIVLAIASYMMSGLSPTEIKVDREVKTLQALKKAKEALIAYAVNYPPGANNRGPGYLPCADQINNGLAPNVGCLTAGVVPVKRLPWLTLGIGDVRDGANERLWYAVSRNFDMTGYPATHKINTATTGNLTVRDKNNNIIYDGTTIDAAVAVIIAPGGILTRDDGVAQVRGTDAEKNDPVNYLDIDIASGEDNATFQQGVLGGATKDGFIDGEIINAAGEVIVNDQIMVITYSDIMEQLHKRVSREISNVINAYVAACGNYPDASSFDPTKVADTFTGDALLREGHIPVDSQDWGPVDPIANPTPCADGLLPKWLEKESWHRVTYYEFAATTPGCGVEADCLIVEKNAVTLINNADALMVFAGRDKTGTRAGSALMSDYFEGENDDGNLVVDIKGLIYDSTQTEDYVHVIAP